MKKILLIATGGTIASMATDSGLRPGLSPERLYDLVPELSEMCELHTRQLLNIDSTNIQPEHWMLIAGAIEESYHQYDGFVITHGTDTMAYTAAALTYLIQDPDKPILLTGSQRPLLDPITDARKNLVDSVRLACEDQVGGVYVVFCGAVICGSRARKVKTKSYLAFDSVNYPVAALVDSRHLVRYVDLAPAPGPVRFYHRLLPNVFLLKLIPGIEPDILDYVGEKYEAIVIESYGTGGLPFFNRRNFLEKLESLAQKGRIVVIATQVFSEGSDAELYEVGLRAISQYGLLQTYDMTIEAAVTKLMWLLGKTRDPEQLRQEFYTPVARDILILP